MKRHVVAGVITGSSILLVVGVVVVGFRPARPGPQLEQSYLPATLGPAQPTASPGPTSAAPGPRPSAAWVELTASRSGIPVAAVDAYAGAVLRIGQEQPGCHLGWTTLAGIGYVESQHGTIDGRTLAASGFSSTPVIGPALDGEVFALVRPDRVFVRWHGDREYEHAVGPLQFIGSTWQDWGADADGDGAANPLSIYDAALAAARYLCADGHDLATGEGWASAVRSYNHSDEYVAAVLDAANYYAERAG